MSKDDEDLKKSRDGLDAARKAPKPNNEQLHAHVVDVIAKMRKSSQKTAQYFEERLKKLTEPK